MGVCVPVCDYMENVKYLRIINDAYFWKMT